LRADPLRKQPADCHHELLHPEYFVEKPGSGSAAAGK